MKLIRLSKNAQNVTKYKGDKLIFNTTFRDDLTVKPNAKIAFQSIFFDEFTQDFIIDATNDIVILTIEGEEYEIVLNRDTYTVTTYPVFFNDFRTKLNKITPFNQYTFGREWNVVRNTNKRLVIEFKYGDIGTANLSLTNVVNNAGVFSADPIPVGNDSYLYNREAMAKASGALRAKINSFGQMVLGVRLNPLNDNSGALDTTSFALAIGVNNGNEYIYYVNGVLNTTGIPIQADDIMEIRIDAGRVMVVYYRANVENLLYRNDYLFESYYPFCLFQSINAAINNFIFAGNPYLPTKVVGKPLIFDYVSIPEPLPDPTINVKLEFQNDTFADILGFESNPVSETSKQITFTGTDKFDSLTLHKLYSVKLSNTPLESYDGETQAKSQILYVINEQSDGQDFSFTAPYLTFLELKNDKPLSLRNIRCEIVDEDDDIVEFFGKAVMSLVVDDN
jgi:hypothetical protein